MQRLRMEEGVPIEHGMVTRAIERAQKQVEARTGAKRAEYDDVMNRRRENIYALRRSELLEGNIRIQDEEAEEVKEIDTRAYLAMLAEDVVDDAIGVYAAKTQSRKNGISTRSRWTCRACSGSMPATISVSISPRKRQTKFATRSGSASSKYDAKEQRVGANVMRQVERFVMLETVDRQWKDHLYSLDHLKEGIGLRGYKPEGSACRCRKLRAVSGHEAPCRRRHGEQVVDRTLRSGQR